MKRIESKEAWQENIQYLNLFYGGKLDHFGGEPEKYPCLIQSRRTVSDYGPDWYDHEFFYQKEIECPQCSSVHFTWDVESKL